RRAPPGAPVAAVREPRRGNDRCNAVGRSVPFSYHQRRTGDCRMSVAITEDDLLDAARSQTGLSDFGSDDFWEGLKRLLADLNSGPALRNPAMTTKWFSRNLKNRLLIQDSLKRHPEILD